MSSPLRIALAQLNLLVGDVPGNVARIAAAAIRARDELAADLVVFPELALSGYPPEDLLLRDDFRRAVTAGLEQLRAAVRGIHLLVGYPRTHADALYNAAALLRDGAIEAVYHKHLLPNYSVFDEKRYFSAGTEACVADVRGVPVGITICEDIWAPGPVRQAAAAGARLILNLNASPFHLNKAAERERVAAERAAECGLPLVYVNQVGGQDELVFDGQSFVTGGDGAVRLRAPAFVEDLSVVGIDPGGAGPEPAFGALAPLLCAEASVYQALVLGVRDYIRKNGFDGAVLGLSGGIDSALCLAIAVDAIGPERVEAILMPSRYTSAMSVEDAQSQAQIMGSAHRVISIEPPFQAFLASLREAFSGCAPDVTEENIQARCRGVLLMAISNKTRRILLTTGNKSEMSVGYATLYGDMAGGFAPIKDVPKTLVYRLARYRNGIAPVIPQRVFDRPPSAELAPDQKDSDLLPPYEVLDPILERYVELDQGVDQIIAAGFSAAVVHRVAQLVDRNEYKRRQAPPGVRISRRAFGRDRRYPLTCGHRHAGGPGSDPQG
ncbi:MAG: NAD+ synthase [Chromatiales bacterium 21-64-14]|nr:MAG: NAD+ synthase [Chromatiales bacterium 21-64-14]HQU14870.1 NAD+ synthase [Gammaproteobacteria bacterium]